MARSVKAHEHAEKRKAILDAAQRYIMTKGYEQMTTRDILEELQISRGAFYHYFDSKSTLLFALIERMGEEIEQFVLPIVQDAQLSALDKLQRFFTTLDYLKLAHKRLVLAFIRVWYANENAIVRHKFYVTRIKRLAPWLTEIIQQGVEEGVFTTSYPEQVARMILSLLEDMGYTIVEILLAEEREQSDVARITRIIEATTEALERLLGVQPGCLQLTRRDKLSQWLVSSSEETAGQPVQLSYNSKSEERAL